MKDNQHPWEKAYIGVFSHPFFMISDEQGGFKITGVPPTLLTGGLAQRAGEQTTEIWLTFPVNRHKSISHSVRQTHDPRPD